MIRQLQSRHGRAVPMVEGLVLQAFLFAALLLMARTAQGQLSYDGTTYIHGFGSGGYTWTQLYTALDNKSPSWYLGSKIDVKSYDAPSLDSSKTYTGELQNLRAYLVSTQRRNVLIGHSMGGLEARGAYVFTPDVRSDIAGILTVATPHEGAYLANNADLARNYLVDVQRRVNQAASASRWVLGAWEFLLGAAVLAVFRISPTSSGPWLAGLAVLFNLNWAGQDLNLDMISSLTGLPARPSLMVGADTINLLNARYDDDVLPRANIKGHIPKDNAAIRVRYSMAGDDFNWYKGVREKRRGMAKLKACKVAGYAIVVTSPAARKCAFARKALGRLDDRWLGFVNGYDAAGHPRDVPFDGIVANEREVYPTSSTAPVSYETTVEGVDHFSIYHTATGLDAVATGMRQMGMGLSTAPLSITTSGPRSLTDGIAGTWSASVSYGWTPYTFTWSGVISGTGSSITRVPSGSGYVYLTVVDANGKRGTTSFWLDVTSTCDPGSAC